MTILEFVIIGYVIVITSCLLCRNKYGYTQFGDNTLVIVDSYNVAELSDYKKGDLLIVETINYSTVKPGDVIYYYDTLNEAYIIRKGVVKEVSGDSYSAVYILEENSISISQERAMGKAKTSYSDLGSFLSVLESRLGFLLIVILPIFVLFIYQVYRMVVLLKLDPDEES